MLMIFDKGKPLTKEFCEMCKKEITPGEKNNNFNKMSLSRKTVI
jgi:hypothetical protein